MTNEQLNPEHCIQALYSSSSEDLDSKFTTKLNIQKVKYDKTNPLKVPQSEETLKKMLKYNKTNPFRAVAYLP